MPHLTPIIGDTVIFFAGGAGTPSPALVQGVASGVGAQTLRLIVFGSDGSTAVKYNIVHRDQWQQAGSPDGYWEYPGSGVTDTLAPGS
jgi:hypothetical protein